VAPDKKLKLKKEWERKGDDIQSLLYKSRGTECNKGKDMKYSEVLKRRNTTTYMERGK